MGLRGNGKEINFFFMHLCQTSDRTNCLCNEKVWSATKKPKQEKNVSSQKHQDLNPGPSNPQPTFLPITPTLWSVYTHPLRTASLRSSGRQSMLFPVSTVFCKLSYNL